MKLKICGRYCELPSIRYAKFRVIGYALRAALFSEISVNLIHQFLSRLRRTVPCELTDLTLQINIATANIYRENHFKSVSGHINPYCYFYRASFTPSWFLSVLRNVSQSCVSSCNIVYSKHATRIQGKCVITGWIGPNINITTRGRIVKWQRRWFYSVMAVV